MIKSERLTHSVSAGNSRRVRLGGTKRGPDCVGAPSMALCAEGAASEAKLVEVSPQMCGVAPIDRLRHGAR